MTEETNVPAEVVEAIYGRAALDEMTTVTAESRRPRDDLRSFVIQARKAVAAIRARRTAGTRLAASSRRSPGRHAGCPVGAR